MASHGDGISRNTASAMFETPNPFLQTSWLVTVTRCSTPCSRNSSLAFSALCWWNSTVYRCPVGATVLMRAWDRDPLPVPRKDKQLMKYILTQLKIRTKVFSISPPAWTLSQNSNEQKLLVKLLKENRPSLTRRRELNDLGKSSQGTESINWKSGKLRTCLLFLEYENNAKGQLQLSQVSQKSRRK